MAKLTLISALLLLALPPAHAQKSNTIAIRNGHILTVSGSDIPRGTVIITNGKITAVGVDAPIPAGATILDAASKIVMPGLVDANARFGMRETANERSSEITPQMRVLLQLNPRSPEIHRALLSGVTSACITPGSANVVGGLCGVIKTHGDSLGEMHLRDGVAEKAALGQDTFTDNGQFRSPGGNLSSIYIRRPNTRMGAVFELRRALDLAEKSPALVRVRSGGMPLRVHARVANDIRAAITIADEFKVPKLIIEECVEGYRDLDVLSSHHISVVLGPLMDPQVFATERSEPSLNNAGLLSSAGVPVAFGTNGGDETALRLYASLAVHYGMAPELALKAITLTAANIAGVGDRVGSLQTGKDGDVLILSGDPLEMTSRIETIVVNGQVVYRAE